MPLLPPCGLATVLPRQVDSADCCGKTTYFQGCVALWQLTHSHYGTMNCVTYGFFIILIVAVVTRGWVRDSGENIFHQNSWNHCHAKEFDALFAVYRLLGGLFVRAHGANLTLTSLVSVWTTWCFWTVTSTLIWSLYDRMLEAPFWPNTA